MFKPLTPKTLEIVETKNGRLRGFKQRDIYNFLGVQYGDCERWQTATMVQPWKGIKNALQFGNRSFPAGPFTPWDTCGVAHEAYAYSEDCLNVNIWTTSIEKTAKKPVMVWMHGGGFATGSAMEMQAHDGENLSRFGDVVVVGINHRLNVFGFLDMSKFGEKYENSGNCGISDLVLALQWVHDNIESFGGDPDNVLIFGQSGGGQKVTCMLQCPDADGLFHKAVIQSGVQPYVMGADPIIKEDSDRSDAIVDLLLKKCETESLNTLEELTPEELLDTYYSIVPELKSKGFDERWWTAITSDYYVGYPYVVGFTEHAKTIPVMIGCTLSEMPLMRIFNKNDYTKQQQIKIVKEAFPEQDADKLIELFVKAWPNKSITDAIEMSGSMDVRASVIRFSDLRAETCSAPTYTYMFAHDFPQDGGRSPWHCAELPIIFHNSALYPKDFHTGLLEGLENAMSGSWVAFAHNSNPNNKYLDVKWPEYKKDECATMIFDDECEVKKDFDRELVTVRRKMQLSINDKYTKFTQLVN